VALLGSLSLTYGLCGCKATFEEEEEKNIIISSYNQFTVDEDK